MKEELNKLTLLEKETSDREGKTIVIALDAWTDNAISDVFMEDTLGIAIKDCRLLSNEEIDEDYEDRFTAIWLTKHQAIILRSYLDNFIQLAETETELNEKEEV